MVRSATLTMMAVLALALGCAPASAGRNESWPKNGKFACSGVLAKGEDGYMLTPDPGMLAWCDAAVRDEDRSRVLDTCKLGGRCEIKGSIMGHGAFAWTEIVSVRGSEASVSPATNSGRKSLSAMREAAAVEHQFGILLKVKAWQPRAAAVDLADMDAWNMFFPRTECEFSSSDHPEIANAIRYVAVCPRWAGSRQLTFRFRHLPTDPQAIYLEGLDVDGRGLSVPEYEAFIEKPFFAYGSFQGLLHDKGMMRVVTGEDLVEFMSVDAFSEAAESSIYTCGVVRQKAPEAVIGCRVDESTGAKTPPFFVQIRQTDGSWLLHTVQTQGGSLKGKAMIAFLRKAVRSR